MDKVIPMHNKHIKIDKYWIPTEESSRKILLIQIEVILNVSDENVLNNKTPFEDTIIHKNPSNFFNAFPVIKKTPFFHEYLRMLPLNNSEFKYKSVYSKTGGLLNLFNPTINENMDKELKRLLNEYKDEKEAISIWKDTPSDLWSNLPPKLVWAGGGKIEGELLIDFLRELTYNMEGKGFGSQGDAILSSLQILRTWQSIPNEICSYKKPMNVITEEREKIYKRKISFLQQMQIETDFS